MALELHIPSHKPRSSWLVIYVSLFTTILAFFILSITHIQLEGSKTLQAYQKLDKGVYNDLLNSLELVGLRDVFIENTLSKGVRIVIQPQKIGLKDFYTEGSDKLHPRIMPYLLQIANSLRDLRLQEVPQRHAKLWQDLGAKNKDAQWMIVVEGHTDSSADTEKPFADKWEKSLHQAQQMMGILMQVSGLPETTFGLVAQGSDRPLSLMDPQLNRRIEIYIDLEISL